MDGGRQKGKQEFVEREERGSNSSSVKARCQLLEKGVNPLRSELPTISIPPASCLWYTEELRFQCMNFWWEDTQTIAIYEILRATGLELLHRTQVN